MEKKQVEAHISHDDGYCSLICQIIWQPDLSEAGRAEFLAKFRDEIERIMKGKR